MSSYLYAAFAFVGFVLCAIPFYWHLHAWNTGTCLYMFWVGLGCLIQGINAIVWSDNMVRRADIYCNIVATIQAAQNVAIPAASLCINRRLYKIATTKTVMVTPADKRRAIVIDLLIGLGLPLLQILSHYIVQGHQFDIFEDFGPFVNTVRMYPSIPLYALWPLVVGIVSLFYCVRTIYHLYRRRRQFGQIMSSNHGLNQNRYLRLMCLALIEILGTIPACSFLLAYSFKLGYLPWVSWADTHSDFSRVIQVASNIWKPYSVLHSVVEFFRWSFVACAFIFFAFFGFADEARRHYRLVYTSLASRIGLSTSSAKLTGSSNITTSFPHMKSKSGVTISVTTASGDKKRDSTISMSDQLSIPSISIPGDFKADLKIESYSPLESTASSSTSDFNFQANLDVLSSESYTNSLTPPPASVPPIFPETPRSNIRPTSTYSNDAAQAV